MKKLVFLFLMGLSMGVTAMAQQQDSLQQYTGKFIFPDGSLVPSVYVTIEAGKLNFSSEKGTGTLEKVAADSFSIPEYQGTAKYNRSADHNITTVTIDVMGYHMVGTREAAAVAPAKTAMLMQRQRYLKSEREQVLGR